MNNRDYKQTGPNCIYHIYNRGNGKESIFLDDNDFSFFLFRLKQNLFPYKEPYKFRTPPLPEKSFDLICYCLMPNHFHLLLRQNKEISPSKLITRVCTSYSKYFNERYKRVGHVFQDQFKQVYVDNNEYLLWLSSYIHQNPQVAGLTKNPYNYKWSSCSCYLNNFTGSLIGDREIILNQLKGLESYKSFIDDSYKIIKQKKELEYLLLD